MEMTMTNVLPFPAKGEPLDEVTMCTLSINGLGHIDLIINAEFIETSEQHNWLIAKMVDAASRLVDRKIELNP